MSRGGLGGIVPPGQHCVYKPIAGERPLWDFPDGTLAQREYAAYLVSEALGWDIVPDTVLRDGPGSQIYDIRDYACALAVPGTTPVAGDDAAEVRWVSRAELDDLGVPMPSGA